MPNKRSLAAVYRADEACAARRYRNLGDRWLSVGAVRRAMRAADVAEQFITGEASDYEKLGALVGLLDAAPGLLLCDWLVFDLEHVLALRAPLSPAALAALWQEGAERLQERDACLPAPSAPDPALLLPDADFPLAVQSLSARCGAAVTDITSLAEAILCDLLSAGQKESLVLPFSLEVGFERPDPYHANLAFQAAFTEKRRLTGAEKAVFQSELCLLLARLAATKGLLLAIRPTRRAGDVCLPLGDLSPLAELLAFLYRDRDCGHLGLATDTPQALLCLLPFFEATWGNDEHLTPVWQVEVGSFDLQGKAMAALYSRLPVDRVRYLPSAPADLARAGLLASLESYLASLDLDEEKRRDQIDRLLASLA